MVKAKTPSEKRMILNLMIDLLSVIENTKYPFRNTELEKEIIKEYTYLYEWLKERL